MKYLPAIIFALLLVALGLLYQWSVTPSIGTTSGQISDRAREFIQNQPVDERIIQLDTLDQREAGVDTRTGESSCFEVAFPVSVRNIKTEEKEDGCVIKATSDRPKAHYTISSKMGGSLSEHTGVTLREKDDQYRAQTAETFPVGTYKLFISSTEVSLFLLKDQIFYTIVLYDSPRTSEESVQIVLDLAESIQPQWSSE